MWIFWGGVGSCPDRCPRDRLGIARAGVSRADSIVCIVIAAVITILVVVVSIFVVVVVIIVVTVSIAIAIAIAGVCYICLKNNP